MPSKGDKKRAQNRAIQQRRRDRAKMAGNVPSAPFRYPQEPLTVAGIAEKPTRGNRPG